MTRELSDYSPEEKARIARAAKRNIHSECTLIATAGTGLIAIVLSFFGKYTFLPVAVIVNIPPTATWIGLSLAIAAILTKLHYRRSRPIIAWARDLDAAFLYHYQDTKRPKAHPETYSKD